MSAPAAAIVAQTDPALRRRVVCALRAIGMAIYVSGDLAELAGYLAALGGGEPAPKRVLVLDEAFIYPDNYEGCARLKAAAQAPLTVVLLVEPRTRTRWDWNGVDMVLRLPLDAASIAERAESALAAP